MRKIVVGVILAAASITASAWYPGRPWMPHEQHRTPSWAWAAPLIIGGAIGYGVSRYTPPPNPAPIVINLPPAPLGYHYEPFFDQACRCTNYGLVRNQ